MVNKNIQMKARNGNEWDNLFPLTLNENVFNTNGLSLNSQLEEMKNSFEVKISDSENETENKIDDEIKFNPYYEDVNYQKRKDQVTGETYYRVFIPEKDKNGNKIKLKRGFPNNANDGTVTTAKNFSEKTNATVVINASVFNISTNRLRGISILNGQIISGVESLSGRNTLAFENIDPAKDFFRVYADNTDPSIIINDGYQQAVTGFLPLVINGQGTTETVNGNPNDLHPRQIIAMKDKDFYIYTFEGRKGTSRGMSYPEMTRILLSDGMDFGFSLDGGGSTQTVYKNVQLNQPLESGLTASRDVPDFLYFGKDINNSEIKNKEVLNIYDELAKLKEEIHLLRTGTVNERGFSRLNAPSDFNYPGIEVHQKNKRINKLGLEKEQIYYNAYNEDGDSIRLFEYPVNPNTPGADIKAPKVDSLNSLNKSGLFWAEASTTGVPTGDDTSASYGVLHFDVGEGHRLQIAFPFTASGGITTKFRRTKSPYEFHDWKDLQ